MYIRAKHVAIDFYLSLRKNLQKTYMLMSEAYKEDCFAKCAIQYWHKSFSDGCQETGMLPQSGRPKSLITESHPPKWAQQIKTCVMNWSTILKKSLPWISTVTTSIVKSNITPIFFLNFFSTKFQSGSRTWSYKKHCNPWSLHCTVPVVSSIDSSWTTEQDGAHGSPLDCADKDLRDNLNAYKITIDSLGTRRGSTDGAVSHYTLRLKIYGATSVGCKLSKLRFLTFLAEGTVQDNTLAKIDAHVCAL